jgi:hypothetical protein
MIFGAKGEYLLSKSKALYLCNSPCILIFIIFIIIQGICVVKYALFIPGKLDFSVKHQSLQTDSIAGADLLPFSSLPVAVEASADSYHCQSPLMHVTPMPSLSSPASITPSSTLVQCPDLLSTAVPPGSQ